MYLKKKATVLISTVIILSLMSMLGCFLYKMMRNNNEIATLYNFDKDIYDLDKDEEVILNKFMKELNEKRAEELRDDKEDTFPKEVDNKIEDNSFKYDKDYDKIFLTTNKDKKKKRRREITYILRNEKIILVPTYKFENNSE
ncbi:hypothetical protein psyc5s11_29620 [Clostridium gelidum]|uniref:Lipoprotein n=1 Tax=Clostridium gelidum TaxID=704125 RepID=A0ABM7T4Q6_9CLOT|nr:hypothetical protein [Clostridium gelidum]BCZ46895.1 hypothetical protein psyc5s11_29620 [Clostridium gelidum]